LDEREGRANIHGEQPSKGENVKALKWSNRSELRRVVDQQVQAAERACRVDELRSDSRFRDVACDRHDDGALAR
jgi:hypothetical protein